MPVLTILGSAAAIPDADHENAHMAVKTESSLVLIDCVGTPTVRLAQAGLDHNDLTDLLLTHFHPDHVSGVPSLITNIWLLGRKKPLDIYGLRYTVESLETLMLLYEWDEFPNLFPVNLHPLPEKELTLVLENEDLRIFCSPVEHLIPTMGLRIESRKTGQVVAYSGDTMPCKAVENLARNADILIHEATGKANGHSSAAQAGEIAKKAGAKSLYLIHYPVLNFDPHPLIDQAKEKFPGPVALAEDFMSIDF